MTTENARNDLAYIREVMSQTRRFTAMSGNQLILWGLLIGLGCLSIWLLVGGPHAGVLGPIWLTIGIGGGLFSAWLGRYEQRRAGLASWAGRLVGNVWLACGMGYVLLLFVGPMFGPLPHETGTGLAAAITGIGIFLTGTLSGIGWLRNTAWIWWLAAGFMLVRPGLYTLPLFCLLLLFLYVVPGILLSLRHRRYLRGESA